MKNWYVLIDELTHEQECELVQLMFGVSGEAPEPCGADDCLGCWFERYDYWWVNDDVLIDCEKISYKQAVALLEEELSDD